MWVKPKYWNTDQYGGELNNPFSAPMFWQDESGQILDKQGGQPVDKSQFQHPERDQRIDESQMFERMPNPSNWNPARVGGRDYADIAELSSPTPELLAYLNENAATNQAQMGSLGGPFGQFLDRAIPAAVTGTLGLAGAGAFGYGPLAPGATGVSGAAVPGAIDASWGWTPQAGAGLTEAELLASGATGAAPGSLAEFANTPTGLPSGSGDATSIIAGDPLQTPWTGALPATPGATSPSFGATGTGSTLSNLLNIDPATGQLIGQVGATALGVLGANEQAGSLNDIANQLRTDRGPALSAFNTALANPNTWYESAPAMGATDAALRKLSISGNPAVNPGSLSKAAAYNLGGYNDYLRTLAGPAFGTAATEAGVGTRGAAASGDIYGALGYGLGALTTPRDPLEDFIRRYSLNLGRSVV